MCQGNLSSFRSVFPLGHTIHLRSVCGMVPNETFGLGADKKR